MRVFSLSEDLKMTSDLAHEPRMSALQERLYEEARRGHYSASIFSNKFNATVEQVLKWCEERNLSAKPAEHNDMVTISWR